MTDTKQYIDILTLFPDMFVPFLTTSIIGRAIASDNIAVQLRNIRDFSTNKHDKVDDYPYGGGSGLVLMIQPIYDAIAASVAASKSEERPEIIMLTPQGEPFSHPIAQELATKQHLIFLCGHYEGFDERIREHLVTRELSLGDFVMTGGEIPAMAMIDASVRLRAGVIKPDSIADDSFATNMLEYPQYTRPQSFNGWDVPEVLLSGNHKEIANWRQNEQRRRTAARRPDLLTKDDE
jgi:tRNA (guanine37-N1)-methyltransferase